MNKITWFKTFIKGDIKIILGTIVLGILISTLGLATAVFAQRIIDDILPKKDVQGLIEGILLITSLLVVKQILTFFQQYFNIQQSRNFNIRLISKFYDVLLHLPKSFFDRFRTGDLITRMNDTASIRQTITYITNTLILNILTVIVSSTVLFFYSASVGLVALSAFPSFLLLSFLFRKKLIYGQIEVMEANATKETNYITTIQNISIVKSTNKEDFFAQINNYIFGMYQQKVFKLGHIGITLGNLAEFTGAIIFIVLLGVASLETIRGSITIGAFAAILGITAGILPAVAVIAFSHLHLVGAKVAFDRVYELASLKKEYDIEEEEKKNELEDIVSLRISRVSFGYLQGQNILKDVSLEVSKGELVCIFGENGSGKSTILHLLQSFYKPGSGGIFFNNVNMDCLSIPQHRNKIAFVSQQPKLFNVSVLENICLEINNKDVKDSISYLSDLGFDRFFEKLPNGYNTIVHEGGQNLSGGQLQMISFARALYRKPKLLLMDEPTSAMDSESENFMIGILHEFKKDAIVIIVSHRLKPAKLADRIYVLKNGMVHATESHIELLASTSV